MQLLVLAKPKTLIDAEERTSQSTQEHQQNSQRATVQQQQYSSDVTVQKRCNTIIETLIAM